MSVRIKFWIVGAIAAFALLLAGAMVVPVYHVVSYYRGMDLYKRGVREMEDLRSDEAIALFDAAVRKKLDATNMSEVYGYRGWAYYGKGLDDQAIRDFSESIRLNPKPAYVFMDRGRTYHRKGEFEKASTDFSEALARNPNLAEAYHKRAQIAAERGDWVQAIADFSEAIRCEPENAQFLVDRGMAFAANNELNSAIANFDAAIGFNQQHAGAYIQRAAAYGRKGNLTKGLADVTDAVRRLPKAPSLRYARAWIYLDRGAVGEAIADCDESIRLDPEYDLGYSTRARAHLLTRDWDNVLADTAAALKLNPSLSYADYLRGRALTAQGRFDEAITDFDEAIRLEPGLQWALIWRALNYSFRDEHARALQELRQTLERFPRSAVPHIGLAWFLATCPELSFRNGPEAVALGMKGCEISHWSNWAAIDTLAAAYAESGDFDQAIQFVRLALGLPGLSPRDRALLEERLPLYRDRVALRDRGPSGGSQNPIEEGISAFARNEYDRALECFNSVLPPPNPGSHHRTNPVPWMPGEAALTNAFYYRGQTYQRKQQWDNAIADFTTVLRREPESMEALRERGVTYSMKGETDRGLQDFDEVIRLRPGDPLAYMLRADTLQAAKQWAAAVEAANIAIQLNPRRSIAYHIRGKAYLGLKKYDKAARDFGESDRLEPNRPDNFHARAQVFAATGDYKSALAEFRELPRRFPRSAEAHNALAWFLATCPDAAYRNGAEAVEHAKSACELTRWENAAELDTLAAAHAEAGDFDQAVKFVTQAISKMEPNALFRAEVEGHLALFQRKEACREQKSAP